MSNWTIHRTGFRPVEFSGELIAVAKTQFENSSVDYSGETGRRQECYIYRTEAGRYVLHICNFSTWVGEEDTSIVETFSGIDTLVTYIELDLGGKIARKLIEELAELVPRERIE